MIPFSEMRVLDINSEHLGITPEFLMEEAGKRVASLVKEMVGEGSRVGIVCGTGKNGGDGFVAARYLMDAMEVTVILARPPEEIRLEIALKNFERVRDIHREYDEVNISEFDLLVDGLLGTGARERVDQPYRTIISQINDFSGKVVSIDVPSGLGADVQVFPDLTITFHDLKVGMSEENSGKIVVQDIGIPPEAEEFVGPGEFIYYPIPKEDSARGDNGSVLIFAGGFFPGATALAGLAAYRIGVDLVHIAAPALAYAPIIGFSPNFIVHQMSSMDIAEDDLPLALDLTKKVDSLLLGGGLRGSGQSQEIVLELLERCEIPLVLNTDGMTLTHKDLPPLDGRKGVILIQQSDFEGIAGRSLGLGEKSKETVKEFAAEIGLTVLVKGKVDIVSNGREVRSNRTGNPSMSVGGTGDTLAGILVGLLAKDIDPFNAARIASFTNGYAGDLAYESMGFGMVASDLVDRIPEVLHICLEKVL